MFSIKVSKKLVRGLKLQLFQFQNQDVVLVKKQKPSAKKNRSQPTIFGGEGFVKWSWMIKIPPQKKLYYTKQNGRIGILWWLC